MPKTSKNTYSNKRGYKRGIKRGYKRRSKLLYRRQMNTLTNKNGFPFPLVYRTTLPFTYKTTVAVASGISSQHYFKANSLYDPVIAIGGNQPIGFDQLMAIYAFYTVSSCKVRFIASSGTTAPMKLYLFPTIDPFASSTTEYTCLQMPGCKSYVIGGNSADGYITGSAWAKTRDVLINLSKDEYGVTQTGTADPTYMWYWNFVFASNDSTSTTNIALTLEITYYAEFKGRIVLPES